MIKENYDKMKISIRGYLIGMGYYKAVEAMNFAEKYHNGTRKDGNHEFSHQVSQANLYRTYLPHVRQKELGFILIFLHDIVEDKDISLDEIEAKWGIEARYVVDKLTKEYRGHKKPNNVYYNDIADCPVSSIGKGIDRVHNLTTMLGGFKPQKRIEYIQETQEYVLPMLKQARRNFPDQECVYENLKFIIINQINLYNALDKDFVRPIE